MLLEAVVGDVDAALSDLISEVYAAGRAETAWPAVAEQMVALSSAEVLLILREKCVVAQYGASDEEVAGLAGFLDPCSARAFDYRVDLCTNRHSAQASAWLIQRYALPDADSGVLTPLLSHLARSLESSISERSVSSIEDELTNTLRDRIPVAVFEIAPDFTVHEMNEAARELVAQDARLWLDDNALRFAEPSVGSRLRQSMLSNASHHVELISTEDASGGLALCLRLAAHERSWLLVHDTEHAPRPSARELMNRYQLSAREAELAVEMSSAATIANTAKRFGVSQATLRTQLKSVFRKIGTHSQAELVIRLRNDPAWLFGAHGQEKSR